LAEPLAGRSALRAAAAVADDRPRRRLVGRVEEHGPQPRVRALEVADHPIALAYLEPVGCGDVEREHAGDLGPDRPVVVAGVDGDGHLLALLLTNRDRGVLP